MNTVTFNAEKFNLVMTMIFDSFVQSKAAQQMITEYLQLAEVKPAAAVTTEPVENR